MGHLIFVDPNLGLGGQTKWVLLRLAGISVSFLLLAATYVQPVKKGCILYNLVALFGVLVTYLQALTTKWYPGASYAYTVLVPALVTLVLRKSPSVSVMYFCFCISLVVPTWIEFRPNELFESISMAMFAVVGIVLFRARVSVDIDLFVSQQREDEAKEKVIELEKKTAEQARRIVHDIKSPLSALNVALDLASDTDLEVRKLMSSAIVRIQDITMAVSTQNKIAVHGLLTANDSNRIYALHEIDSLILEKQLEYRDYSHIQFQKQFLESAYSSHAFIPGTELKTTLSNIINNAVESIQREGVVSVILKVENEFSVISVSDNGKGISEKDLLRVTEKGFSSGKDNGSGLGLYLARESVASWGGTLKVDSELYKGTTVTISVPCVEPPSWFASEFRLGQGGTIVVLDDDVSIHRLWVKKLKVNTELSNTSVKCFRSSYECSEWLNSLPNDESIKYLIDYELDDHDLNGLDFAEQMNLGSEVLLVTSHFDNREVQERCLELGVNMVPKPYLSLVPLFVT